MHNIYRVAICHDEDCGYFLLIKNSQISSIVRVGHVCDWPFNLECFPLVLERVALNGVQANYSILRTEKKKEFV